jgi:hypothetical protein
MQLQPQINCVILLALCACVCFNIELILKNDKQVQKNQTACISFIVLSNIFHDSLSISESNYSIAF